MNSLFGLKMQVVVGEKMIVGLAVSHLFLSIFIY